LLTIIMRVGEEAAVIADGGITLKTVVGAGAIITTGGLATITVTITMVGAIMPALTSPTIHGGTLIMGEGEDLGAIMQIVIGEQTKMQGRRLGREAWEAWGGS
jgi:hypothetical protein